MMQSAGKGRSCQFSPLPESKESFCTGFRRGSDADSGWTNLYSRGLMLETARLGFTIAPYGLHTGA